MTSDDEYFSSEEFKETLEQYEAAARSGQLPYMDVDDLVDIADYYHMNDRLDEAETCIERALELFPGATAPLVYRIHEALNDGDVETARHLLELIDDKSDLEYLFISNEILIAENKIDEADRRFSDYFRDITPEEHQDFVVDVANTYSDYNVHEKAMEWMARAKPEDNDNFKELVARTMFGLGKYNESEKIFNELVDSNPFSKYYWNALASVQFMKEDYGAAVSSSEYAIAIDPDDPESILSKANGLYRLNNYEEALKYFERYTEKMPFDEFGLLYQGTCLINLGRTSEAIELLEYAVKVAPPDSPYLTDIFQELAFSYSEQGKADTAIYYLDQTDTLDCDHIDVTVVKGHVLLANNRREEAEGMFKKALIDSGNAPKTILRILVSLYDNKYVNAAYIMFKKFLQNYGEKRNDGYAYMALCCWDLEKYDEFLHYLKIATQKNPHEASMVLAALFPQDMKPEEYYSYMIEKLQK